MQDNYNTNAMELTNALSEATDRVTLGPNAPNAWLGRFIKQVASSWRALA